MPESQPQPIALPESAVKQLAEGQRRLAEVQGQVNSFISGLRVGLSVPEEWKLDLQKKAFVPSNGKAAE